MKLSENYDKIINNLQRAIDIIHADDQMARGYIGGAWQMINKITNTTNPSLFDEISIDVSTGEHDHSLRAFAKMPPMEIMEYKGQKIALFEGELNQKINTIAFTCEKTGMRFSFKSITDLIMAFCKLNAKNSTK